MSYHILLRRTAVFERHLLQQFVVTTASHAVGNITFALSLFQDRPYVFDSTQAIDGIPIVGRHRFYGYCADLAELVARSVGYEYHIRLVRDGQYGSPQGDGTWNGMIGELIRHVSLCLAAEFFSVLIFTF